MLRGILGAFLIAHGLVHIAIWAPQYDPAKSPFDAANSWLIGVRRPLALFLAFAAAIILVVASIGVWADAGWWRPTVIVGLAVSTVLLLLYFVRWYVFILAVNVALIVAVGTLGWP